MSSIAPLSSSPLSPAALELYRAHRQSIYRRTDRMFAVLMGLQWVFGIVAAFWISPRAWAGAASSIHPHVWSAVVLGGIISALPIALAILRPGHTETRYVISVAQMLTSGLLIHLMGGRIETHFHVFGSLAFLAFYCEWQVLIPATLVVALDHLLRGIYFPQSVYGLLYVSPWRSFEHAAWVIFEDVFLIAACLRAQRDMREIARRAADLNAAREFAESAARAKTEFLANMSHEIRTPLNSILGFTNLILSGADENNEQERQEWLGIIRSAGKHLLEVINQILDLSKLESGKIEIERIPCAPTQILGEVISILRPRAEEKDLQLELRYDCPIPATLLIDPTRLRQLLINIVGNAIKFTESGSIRVLAALICDDTTSRLRIRIADTGIGIPAEKLSTIFAPFAQADSSTTRRYGGTGLGLAISKRIAEAMGGTLTVSSEPGRGSVFTFEIETGSLQGIEMISAPLTEAVRIQPHNMTLSSLRGRILLVDDGITNRKLIELVLRRAGAEVVSAENGQIAVELASGQPFDLILMDMQMPVMDGYTATQILRKKQVQVPIIALTAHAMKEDRDRCLAAGCSGYLAKPVEQERLLAMVAEFMSLSTKRGSDGNAMAPSTPPGPRELAIRSTLPMDDPEFREIVEEFVNRLHQGLDKMQSALQEQNLEELIKQAHWLKGSAGTVGFPDFTEPASRLEKLAAGRQLESLEAAIAEVKKLAQRISVDPPAEHALDTRS